MSQKYFEKQKLNRKITWECGYKKEGDTQFYESFCLNGVRYQINDHVLVSNVTNTKDDTEVYQIKDLYDTGKEKFAKVRYFIKRECLPKAAVRRLDLKEKDGPANEVFLSTDKRDTNIIDITQIVGKCQVHERQDIPVGSPRSNRIGKNTFYVRQCYDGKTFTNLFGENKENSSTDSPAKLAVNNVLKQAKNGSGSPRSPRVTNEVKAPKLALEKLGLYCDSQCYTRIRKELLPMLCCLPGQEKSIYHLLEHLDKMASIMLKQFTIHKPANGALPDHCLQAGSSSDSSDAENKPEGKCLNTLLKKKWNTRTNIQTAQTKDGTHSTTMEERLAREFIVLFKLVSHSLENGGLLNQISCLHNVCVNGGASSASVIISNQGTAKNGGLLNQISCLHNVCVNGEAASACVIISNQGTAKNGGLLNQISCLHNVCVNGEAASACVIISNQGTAKNGGLLNQISCLHNVCVNGEASSASVIISNQGTAKNGGLLNQISSLHNVCVNGEAASASVIISNQGTAKSYTALEARYKEIIKPLQFTNCSIPVEGKHSHRYAGELSTLLRQSSKSQVIRIAQELSSLPTSLPLELSSSIFVRTDDDNISLMQALITGPEGTPYSSGCYIFDIHFPSSYPMSPPKVNLKTTGNGTVRFNPNLYNCGTVCLSLLGTWQGQNGEEWNEKTSTILQVLVSIQSLILVPDPYFNEPGFEQAINTNSGKAMSEEYNKSIRIHNINHAMINQLQHPTPGFEEVIKTHFYLKKDLILQEVKDWVRENKCSKLESAVSQLKKELKKLEPPASVSNASKEVKDWVRENNCSKLESAVSQLKKELKKLEPPASVSNASKEVKDWVRENKCSKLESAVSQLKKELKKLEPPASVSNASKEVKDWVRENKCSKLESAVSQLKKELKKLEPPASVSNASKV